MCGEHNFGLLVIFPRHLWQFLNKEWVLYSLNSYIDSNLVVEESTLEYRAGSLESKLTTIKKWHDEGKLKDILEKAGTLE